MYPIYRALLFSSRNVRVSQTCFANLPSGVVREQCFEGFSSHISSKVMKNLLFVILCAFPFLVTTQTLSFAQPETVTLPRALDQ